MGLADRLKEIRREQRVRKWLKPKLTRLFIWSAMGVGLMLKPFPFLKPILPEMLREFLDTWSVKMMWVVFSSFGSRMYIDLPCEFREPDNYQPQVQTAPQWQLTEAQIRQFYEQGFLGPLTAYTPEEMVGIREQVLREISTHSQLLGIATKRDRHLDCPSVFNFVNHPAIADRMAQILGPDLMLWRTQAFMKEPGMAGFTFHQASCFLSAEGYRCVLNPPDTSVLFELSAWVAFDDVDLENGCVQLIKGSHREIRKIRVGGTGGDDEAFVDARFTIEMDIKPEDVVTMEMKAGQFFLFTERTVHGSPRNNSNRRRWGTAFRVVRPHTKVYKQNASKHSVQYLRESYDLRHWGGIMLRGEDQAHVNRILLPPTVPVVAEASVEPREPAALSM